MVNAPLERLNAAGSAAYVHGSGMYVRRCSWLSQKSSTTALDRWSSTTRYGDRRTRGVRQEGEEHGTYDAPRGLGAPLPGTRPPPLPEVAGPQGRPVAPLSPGAGVPSLASPALAGLAGEGVGSLTTRKGEGGNKIRPEPSVRPRI